VKIRLDPVWVGKAAAGLMKALGYTLRMEMEDRAGVANADFTMPLIWAFWHNRMVAIPLMRPRLVPHRRGSALTSASRDGAIIEQVMKSFGLGSVRGSSSRRGGAALIGLREVLEKGEDPAITPDGPRGPVYKLGQGVVYLAQQTGTGILPIHIEYSRAVRLKSWDRFMIPLPFSKVHVTFDEIIFVAPEADIEEERVRIEALMQPETR
jgi:lysophospholipid acyltransferase (LPLAT)-like uncharacterized protein